MTTSLGAIQARVRAAPGHPLRSRALSREDLGMLAEISDAGLDVSDAAVFMALTRGTGDLGFLKKIFKEAKRVVKKVGKEAKRAMKHPAAATVANFIPGVGQFISGGISAYQASQSGDAQSAQPSMMPPILQPMPMAVPGMQMPGIGNPSQLAAAILAAVRGQQNVPPAAPPSPVIVAPPAAAPANALGVPPAVLIGGVALILLVAMK